jgi:arylsulfatase A-like enzyme
MVTIRVNAHHLWMRPLGLMAIFLAVGGLASLWLRRRPRAHRSEAAVSFLLCVLTMLSPLWSLEELHPGAAFLLACGLGRVFYSALLKARPRRLSAAAWGVVAVGGVVMGIGLFRTLAAEPLHMAMLANSRADAPNVVLLVLDTVRADHLGHHGHTRDTMPVLRELAARGVTFENARATATWTLPSHASMFTGKWLHELSVDIDRPLDGGDPTIAEVLSRQGHRTAGFAGNTTYCNAWFGIDRGFSHFDDAPENRKVSTLETFRSSGLGLRLVHALQKARWIRTHGDYAQTRLAESVNHDALTWLDRQGTNDPFFLFLNYYDAHGPYVVPDGFPRTFSGADEETFRKLVKQYRRLNTNHMRAAGPELEAEISRLGKDAYDDCLRYLDSQLATLVSHLERRALASGRTTWLIVTSDHGEHFGERGLHRHGNSLYRPLTHVPLVIVPLGPAAEPIGMRVVPPVSLRDLPATIADLAGSRESPFPGRSLRRFWEGAGAAIDRDSLVDPVLAELLFHPTTMANGGESGVAKSSRMYHALIEHGRTYMETLPEGEALFDLLGDVDEANDLAKRPEGASLLSTCRERLKTLLGTRP